MQPKGETIDVEAIDLFIEVMWRLGLYNGDATDTPTYYEMARYVSRLKGGT